MPNSHIRKDYTVARSKIDINKLHFTNQARRNTMLLSPNDVLLRGLQYLRMGSSTKSLAQKRKEFHKHYGSSSLDLADMWYDMTVTDIAEARIGRNELCDKGFRMFLVAHFFLWTYPKNSSLMASRFQIGERCMRGEPVWRWIMRIAALKKKKIKWETRLDLPDTEIFVVTIDGTDFKMWERKHPRLNQDKGQCSVKFNHGAAKYEIAISVYTAQVAWISGPYRGAEHDMTMLRRGGLLDKIQPGKKAIADRGYRSSREEVKSKISLPNPYDSKELNNLKSRARLRHETFNGRLKFFKVLSDTFRHGYDKHKFVVEAVAVIVQYQMDNGSPIYAV
jgi:hypothetical protein